MSDMAQTAAVMIWLQPAAQLGIPHVRHFVYMAKARNQVTSPDPELPYTLDDERRRWVAFLATVWNLTMHACWYYRDNSFVSPGLQAVPPVCEDAAASA
jgi:hypothetical protein